jgi:hypothetical protein
MANTGENDMHLHINGMFLPVSLARKVLFCTFKFLYIFETLPVKKNYVYISEFSKNVLLSSPIEFRGTKKFLLTSAIKYLAKSRKQVL